MAASAAPGSPATRAAAASAESIAAPGGPLVTNGTPWYRRAQRLIPWLYLAVPLTLLITFVYVPVVNLFYYSITNWDGITPNPALVWLSNYKEIFTNPEYFDVFKVATYYLVASFVQIALALYFATILSFNVRFRNLSEGRALLPLPHQRRRDRRSSSCTSSSPAARSTRRCRSSAWQNSAAVDGQPATRQHLARRARPCGATWA